MIHPPLRRCRVFPISYLDLVHELSHALTESHQARLVNEPIPSDAKVTHTKVHVALRFFYVPYFDTRRYSVLELSRRRLGRETRRVDAMLREPRSLRVDLRPAARGVNGANPNKTTHREKACRAATNFCG